MCGLVGEFGPACSEHRLRPSLDLLGHRGPDGSGTWLSASRFAALGHTRLSVIDLSPAGRQPLSNEDGSVRVVYNGEIYNFGELKVELVSLGHAFRSQTDTEVLVHGYEEWGILGLVSRIRGIFAFALWDERTRTGHLVRDRLGVKPLYLAVAGSRCRFASEAKALFPLMETSPEIDWSVLPSLCAFLWLPDPVTMWKGVEKLAPGHLLTWRPDGPPVTTRYWKPLDAAPSESRSDETELEAFQALLREAIIENTISDAPIGAFLSGGIDSSVIVRLMSEHATGTVDTYTICYTDDDQRFERADPDAVHARAVASANKCRHHEIIARQGMFDTLPDLVWSLDEPCADPSAICTFLISDQARSAGLKVLLSGMGADEYLGGYRKHRAVLLARRMNLAPGPLQGALRNVLSKLPVAGPLRGNRMLRWSKRFLRAAGRDDFSAFVALSALAEEGTIRDILPDHDSSLMATSNCRAFGTAWDEAAGLSLVGRMSYADTMVFLPGLNLMYTDRAAMAASVEVRPAFLDHRIVERSLAWPDHFRIARGQQKRALRIVARDWVPPAVLKRPKAPFSVPLRSWLRNSRSELLLDTMSPANLARLGVFDATAVSALRNANSRGLEDHAHTLWVVFLVTLWQQFAVPRMNSTIAPAEKHA